MRLKQNFVRLTVEATFDADTAIQLIKIAGMAILFIFAIVEGSPLAVAMLQSWSP